MKLSEHFSLDEFTTSQEATRHAIDNKPSAMVVEHLRQLANTLEQVRSLLGGNPIHISSGFRCLKLNNHIGGGSTSAHIFGYAVDFTCSSFGTPIEVAQKIAKSDIKFDQLIFEQTWVHLSIDPKNRQQLLTAIFKGGKTFYTGGLNK